MAKLAYIRVSSQDQNTARQRKALTAVGCSVLYEEKVSGATMERPELKRLLDELREDDIVYVHEISRLSRSTKDLLEIIEQIKSKGAGLRSITETWLDTSSANPMHEFLLTIFSGLVQFERSMIKQRQREGIEIAKKDGRFRGRKPELIIGGKAERRLQEIIKAYKEGKSVRHIREVYKVGTGTLYKILEREGLR